MGRTETEFDIDDTGKADFSEIYTRDDPRAYYTTLRRHGYLIPESALYVFRALYAAYRKVWKANRLRLVDVGCSYGVNAALQKFSVSLGELEARYTALKAEGLTSDEVRERDRAWLGGRKVGDDLVITGLDSSAPAIEYGIETGLLDAGLVLDLEGDDEIPRCWYGLEGIDLIISTGAIGYVTEKTFEALLSRSPWKPWIAVFTLRQFEMDRIEALMKPRGYVMEKLDDAVFPQRRFTSKSEQEGAFARLKEIGRKPTQMEKSGWFAAEFFLLRPEADAQAAPFGTLFERHALPAARPRTD